MILQVEEKKVYTLEEYLDFNETLVFNSISFEIAVADIYDKVEF